MEARKQIAGREPDGRTAALRDLVRLLARQAATEFVSDRLPAGRGRG